MPMVQPRTRMAWRTDDGVTLTFIGPSLPFIGSRNGVNDNCGYVGRHNMFVIPPALCFKHCNDSERNYTEPTRMVPLLSLRAEKAPLSCRNCLVDFVRRQASFENFCYERVFGDLPSVCFF